jgi:hypothetical protein
MVLFTVPRRDPDDNYHFSPSCFSLESFRAVAWLRRGCADGNLTNNRGVGLRLAITDWYPGVDQGGSAP